jgi:homoserine dehydrogenase
VFGNSSISFILYFQRDEYHEGGTGNVGQTTCSFFLKKNQKCHIKVKKNLDIANVGTHQCTKFQLEILSIQDCEKNKKLTYVVVNSANF